MKRITTISVLFASLALLGFIAQAKASPIQQATALPKSASTHEAVLADLMARLQGPIAKLRPGATIGFVNGDSGDTLRAQYQTQQFLVYGRGMNGRISSTPYKELGPNYQGFLLEVFTQPAPYNGQLVPNQILHEPYWNTYFDAYEIKHPHECLWVNLSYGVQTNPKLIAQIKQIIWEYSEMR